MACGASVCCTAPVPYPAAPWRCGMRHEDLLHCGGVARELSPSPSSLALHCDIHNERYDSQNNQPHKDENELVCHRALDEARHDLFGFVKLGRNLVQPLVDAMDPLVLLIDLLKRRLADFCGLYCGLARALQGGRGLILDGMGIPQRTVAMRREVFEVVLLRPGLACASAEASAARSSPSLRPSSKQHTPRILCAQLQHLALVSLLALVEFVQLGHGCGFHVPRADLPHVYQAHAV
mmetsp:Transcript_5770/g.14780  ORF Transcript_5770/g.14780 Transcript_5770/m.14780 type:complete len:236 (+) Transcript_5770:239-946(+)